ncbi:DUF6879 family protein [Streptomyces radicis]|uniref:DUF6879 domain-containing protein n=1 Tax=Streptomyces radicis TaxID=1750517 RepID=A0A3A9WFV8_9ACTN|nr:DUF6879 family protein [Streptomyces radicis]RKN12121.1 hypothetical protein D7319_04385 [Streptomyces radicis]RKN25826.1 hypothetical protein D7318_06095 [Streptomyces radicis]
MSQSEPGFLDLLASARHTAMHLEMRDIYDVGDEAADFERWQRTGERDVDPASEYWAPWVGLIEETVARGVAVRRARVVSEPVSDYIRYEHAGAAVNVAAGEDVRWLPRRRASDLLLPGNDLWVFDETAVLFNHFDGHGNWSSPKWEVRTEPDLIAQVRGSLRAVWDRAVPHEQYKV